MALDVRDGAFQLFVIIDENTPNPGGPGSGDQSVARAIFPKWMLSRARECHRRFRFQVLRNPFDRSLVSLNDRVGVIVPDTKRVQAIPRFDDRLRESISDEHSLFFIKSYRWI